MGFASLFLFAQQQGKEEDLAITAKLTTLPFIANSTTFLEHRVTPYSDFSHKLYPQMPAYNYQEFVYAQ